MMRKFIFFLLALLPLGLASYALAADGFVALAPIPGLTEGEVANSYDLPAFFNNLYKYLIGIAAILAIIEIVWGGLEISTKDSVSKQSDGKERIRQAIFGLILVLSPALVFGIINPQILNLRVALDPIDLSFTPYTPSVTTSYTLSDIEQADRPVGTTVLFSFTVAPSVRANEVIPILNARKSECTNYTGGPGIILQASVGTRNFVCQTCESGKTASPFSTCSGDGTRFACGSCN